MRHRWIRTIQQLLFGALSSVSQSPRKTVTPADVVNSLKYEMMVFGGYAPFVGGMMPPAKRAVVGEKAPETPLAQADCVALPAPDFSAASQPCVKCGHPTGCKCEA